MILSFQTILVVCAIAINATASSRYIYTIFKGKTQPHIYTWIVWLITQGIGVAGMWRGGAGIGALPLTFGLGWITIILMLSYNRGTKNITRSDTYALIAALVAIAVWLTLHNPVLAVVMAA